MARQRTELNEKLVGILGTRNVYFEPPPTLKMKYDAIVYNREAPDVKYGDNAIHTRRKKYSLTVISRNPDNDIADRLVDAFEYCKISNHMVVDGLHQDYLTLYY